MFRTGGAITAELSAPSARSRLRLGLPLPPYGTLRAEGLLPARSSGLKKIPSACAWNAPSCFFVIGGLNARLSILDPCRACVAAQSLERVWLGLRLTLPEQAAGPSVSITVAVDARRGLSALRAARSTHHRPAAG